jgi:pilus assembly protein CpaE
LVTPEKVSTTLSYLKEFNEYVVLDLPHDFSPTTLAALDVADVILVVLQPEIVSIRSAVMTMKLFKELEYNLDHVHFIVNWTFPRKGFSIADIERSLKTKITMMLPYASDEFIEGMNLGTPPTFSAPTEPLGVLFEDLALALSKNDHLKRKPKNPSDSWNRAVERYKNRKTTK